MLPLSQGVQPTPLSLGTGVPPPVVFDLLPHPHPALGDLGDVGKVETSVKNLAAGRSAMSNQGRRLQPVSAPKSMTYKQHAHDMQHVGSWIHQGGCGVGVGTATQWAAATAHSPVADCPLRGSDET